MSNELLISSTIDELVSYYSNKEGTNGILRVVDNDSNGMPTIRLIIICTDLVFKTDKYFAIVQKLEEILKKTNVRILVELRDSLEFGLLGIHLLEEGQPNCCGFLVDGDILFDRNGKYQYLQGITNNMVSQGVLKRTRRPVGYVSRAS